MTSADRVSWAAAIEAPRLAWTVGKRRQVEVGGDRLDAEQQGQQHDHGGGGHVPMRGERNGHPWRLAARFARADRAALGMMR